MVHPASIPTFTSLYPPFFVFQEGEGQLLTASERGTEEQAPAKLSDIGQNGSTIRAAIALATTQRPKRIGRLDRCVSFHRVSAGVKEGRGWSRREHAGGRAGEWA